MIPTDAISLTPRDLDKNDDDLNDNDNVTIINTSKATTTTCISLIY
jgi:hypothetical protein